MLEQIKGTWPTFSENSLGIYAGFLKDKAASYGRSAIEHMLKAATDQQISLPTLAELKRYLPSSAVQVKGTTNPQCPDCEGFGWAWADEEKKRVRRCHCWRKESV